MEREEPPAKCWGLCCFRGERNRHVEVSCERTEVVDMLSGHAEASARDSDDRSHRDRAGARRRLDAWVITGLPKLRALGDRAPWRDGNEWHCDHMDER